MTYEGRGVGYLVQICGSRQYFWIYINSCMRQPCWIGKAKCTRLIRDVQHVAACVTEAPQSSPLKSTVPKAVDVQKLTSNALWLDSLCCKCLHTQFRHWHFSDNSSRAILLHLLPHQSTSLHPVLVNCFELTYNILVLCLQVRDVPIQHCKTQVYFLVPAPSTWLGH